MTPKQRIESADGRREGPLQDDVPRDEDHLELPRPKVKIVRETDHPEGGPMRTFRSRADHWQQNYRDGLSANVLPATLEDPEGREVPGVAIFSSSKPRVVVSAEAALRLAHQLADVLSQLNEDEGGHQ